MKSAREEKLAVVASGGGMTCAYSAGVLQALNEFSVRPDFVIGTSGSSCNLAYFTAGQAHVLKNAWLEYVSSKQFIKGTSVNLNYLINDVCTTLAPLDVEAIENSETELIITATELETGKPAYFTAGKEVKKLIRASLAMPLLAEPVRIDGKEYVDGAIGSPIWRTIDEAIARGATRIIVIDNSHKENMLMSLLRWKFPASLRPALKASYTEPRTISVPEGVELIYLTPRRPLPVGVFTIDKKRIAQAMHIGYDDVLRHEQFRRHFTPSYTPARPTPLSVSLSSLRSKVLSAVRLQKRSRDS